MSTNKQRRDAERARLQRQLQDRRRREVARRRTTVVASIVGALVLVGAVVAIVVTTTGGDGDSSAAASGSTNSASPSASGSDAALPCGSKTFPAKTYPAATGPSVAFDGVTVRGATDISGSPGIASKGTTDPTKLAYKDLVVGKGAAASPTACVDVQYIGVQYKNGKQFDSSFKRAQLGGKGQVTEFSLQQVVPGYTQAIGGTSGVPAMRVGGRRLAILPASLAYGSMGNSQAGIAPNTPLVFLIDLVDVRQAAA